MPPNKAEEKLFGIIFVEKSEGLYAIREKMNIIKSEHDVFLSYPRGNIKVGDASITFSPSRVKRVFSFKYNFLKSRKRDRV